MIGACSLFFLYLNYFFKMVAWQGFQENTFFEDYEFTHHFLSFVPRPLTRSKLKFMPQMRESIPYLSKN